jgi:hypothetical protein
MKGWKENGKKNGKVNKTKTEAWEGRKEKRYNRGMKEGEMKNSKTEGKTDETK